MQANPCAREIEWAGGTHTFCLNEPKVLAVLSRDPGALRMARVRSGVLKLEPLEGSPAAALARFQANTYTVPDVERTILLGLWGGGFSLSQAEELVAAHIRGAPLAHGAMVAHEVLAALFVGAQHDA